MYQGIILLRAERACLQQYKWNSDGEKAGYQGTYITLHRVIMVIIELK